ncbi:MAG: glucosaminidase domain-containing protein [Prevotella sp.]|nr:glucosaminidase domain-containing protein [Prevotella sp.]
MNKKTYLFVLLFLSAVSLSAQTAKWNQRYQSYIDKYKDLAIQEMLRYNIPASITLAQGILESGAGESELCRKGNNHFGIKCHDWTGAKVYHDDDATGECFRAYKTAIESYEDHSKFLSNSKRYSKLFQLSRTDYKGWAHGLKECGYATNPRYAYSLIDLIELYKLNEYDRATSYDKFMAQHTGKASKQTTTDLHPIKIYNKNYYLYARKGDTYRSIAKEIGIKAKKLAKYNERDVNDVLEPGEIVYLKKKQKKADRKYMDPIHVVKAGESMYSISQLYGMQLKYLYKLNHLSPDYQIKIGARLKVY